MNNLKDDRLEPVSQKFGHELGRRIDQGNWSEIIYFLRVIFLRDKGNIGVVNTFEI
jgi:hypothetical protein